MYTTVYICSMSCNAGTRTQTYGARKYVKKLQLLLTYTFSTNSITRQLKLSRKCVVSGRGRFTDSVPSAATCSFALSQMQSNYAMRLSSGSEGGRGHSCTKSFPSQSSYLIISHSNRHSPCMLPCIYC